MFDDFLKLLKFLLVGSALRKLKKLAALQKMKKLQRNMAHYRQHEAERQKIKDQRDREQDDLKKDGRNKSWKSRTKHQKPRGAKEIQRKRELKRARDKDEALGHARTIREQVIRSREECKNQWRERV